MNATVISWTNIRSQRASFRTARHSIGGPTTRRPNRSSVACRWAIIASVAVSLSYPAMAAGQTTRLHSQQALLAQPSVRGDFAGSAVATSGSGNTIAVGAPRSPGSSGSYPADAAGVVYVFERSERTGLWSEQARLTAERYCCPQPEDHFGAAVAISDDGNTLVVGAPLPLPFGGPPGRFQVYVFHRDRTVWTLEQTLESSAGSFGASLAIRGSTIVIGAPQADFAYDPWHPSGRAFVYRRGPHGWTWTAELSASRPRGGDEFGGAVAVDEDENTLIIGAPGNAGGPGDGVAFLFEKNTSNGGWEEQAMLTAPLAPGILQGPHEFGRSVSISGATVVVGAPGDPTLSIADDGAAYVFQGPDWSSIATLIPSDRGLGSNFGYAVAIWGGNILVGAPNSDAVCSHTHCNSGSAYLFQWHGEPARAPQGPAQIESAGSWIEVAMLVARDPMLLGNLGWSVAMVGTNIAVGAPSSRRAPSSWGDWGRGNAYAYAIGPAPDLVSTALSDPPPAVNVGDTFSATDTVFNLGSADSWPAATRYYFSVDGRKHGRDGSTGFARSIPVLSPTRSSTGTRTLTVPSVEAGTYFLIACTDETQTNVESNESNNCVASAGTTQVSGADLVETAISNPPASGVLNGTFAVSDTVVNQGSLPAPTSTTRYYFSLDTVRDSSDALLSQSRTVTGPLNPGAGSTGHVTVSIPAMPVGTYFLLACADVTNRVRETDEIDNCRASATTVAVAGPDLVERSVSNPPPTAVLGSTFTLSDTVTNQGNAASGAFTIRYYLSFDTRVDAGDRLLIQTRTVATMLAEGASAYGQVTVAVPSMPSGSYLLLACADDLDTVVEAAEDNNCRPSVTTVIVTGPDLVITAVSNLLTVVAPGAVLPVFETVANLGDAMAGASVTRYYLSADQAKDAGDLRLMGSRAVGALNAGATVAAPVPVTVPPGTPTGTYYLIACADDNKTVVEQDDTNNCRTSAGRILVPLFW